MLGYPLKSVLQLRRRQEEASARALSLAIRAVRAAELEESTRVAAVGEGRARWEAATGMGTVEKGTITTSARLGARAVFAARMRHEWKKAQLSLDAFRSGPLASVRALETEARARHLAARQALSALERNQAAFDVARQRRAERAEDDALEESARTLSVVRHVPGGRP